MSNGYKSSWLPGTYKAICDSCGFLRNSTEMQMRWDGFFVCSATCWEPRQPQDFVRTITDEGKAVSPARPESTDRFQNVEFAEV